MMAFGLGGLGILGMLFFWAAIVGAAMWTLTRVFPTAPGNQIEAGTTEKPEEAVTFKGAVDERS